MRDSDKIWHICARYYLIDIFTKINARHGSLTCLSTSETLRSDSNQKILYSVPVLDKIRPCQARYDEKRLYRRQEPLDQAPRDFDKICHISAPDYPIDTVQLDPCEM